MKEKYLKRKIIDFLKRKGYFVWANPVVGIYNPTTGQYIRASMRGISDILGVLPDGKFLAIEVKGKGGKPTPHQLAFINKVKELGGVGIWAFSLEDVIEGLRKKGYEI